VIVIMPQGIPSMTVFAGAYRSGLAGVTAKLSAKLVVIDEEFPDEMLACVSLEDQTTLLRAGVRGTPDGEIEPPGLNQSSESLALIQHSAGTTGLQKGVALLTPPC
jgi:acyl-CoA synthetase (AMP-forming)/AMP-acid ligase II